MTTLTDPATTDTLWIDPRHNGPRTSGNGGWVAGALARRLAARSGAAVASVALRAPVPLGRPLPLRWQADGGLALHAGDAADAVVADAAPASLSLTLPAAPPDDVAEAAGVAARWRHQQRGASDPYAVCFVCGFDRPDGLGVIVGPVGDDGDGGSGLMATTWVPSATLAGSDGLVSVEATWAALDCPAGMAWSHRLGRGQQIMTVRMTATIDQPLQPGARYRVLAWPLHRDGRKLHAGTAIVDAAGRVCARSQQAVAAAARRRLRRALHLLQLSEPTGRSACCSRRPRAESPAHDALPSDAIPAPSRGPACSMPAAGRAARHRPAHRSRRPGHAGPAAAAG